MSKPYVIWFLGPGAKPQITQEMLAECWYENSKPIVEALNTGREVHMKYKATANSTTSSKE